VSLDQALIEHPRCAGQTSDIDRTYAPMFSAVGFAVKLLTDKRAHLVLTLLRETDVPSMKTRQEWIAGCQIEARKI